VCVCVCVYFKVCVDECARVHLHVLCMRAVCASV
jgi:hypothetical protein